MSSSDGALRRRASKRRFAVAFPAGERRREKTRAEREAARFSRRPRLLSFLFCAFFSGASLPFPPPVYLFAARVHKFCQRRGWRAGEQTERKARAFSGSPKSPRKVWRAEKAGPLSLSLSFILLPILLERRRAAAAPNAISPLRRRRFSSFCSCVPPSACFRFRLFAAARCYSVRFFASPLRFFQPTGDARLLATTRTPIPLGVAGLFAVVAERWRCPPACGLGAALVVVVFRRVVAVFVSCLGRLPNEMWRR